MDLQKDLNRWMKEIDEYEKRILELTYELFEKTDAFHCAAFHAQKHEYKELSKQHYDYERWNRREREECYRTIKFYRQLIAESEEILSKENEK